jgi:hypothetical protein
MTADPETVAELIKAVAELDDRELRELSSRVMNVARHFAEKRRPRLSDVFRCLGVLAAEEGDRRGVLLEHARREAEDDDGLAGGLLSDDPS